MTCFAIFIVLNLISVTRVIREKLKDKMIYSDFKSDENE